MNFRLVNSGDWADEGDLSIQRFPATLGRSGDADVCLSDRWVSRRHCRIETIDGALVVRDLDSSHGTFVNGNQISEAVLVPGDELGLGLSSFIAEFEPEEAAMSASMAT